MTSVIWLTAVYHQNLSNVAIKGHHLSLPGNNREHKKEGYSRLLLALDLTLLAQL
jgi:hypothetical protein